MNAYSKYKNRLEQFLQTERGKRFIHFAYSIGAAIVILGAMFKILHLPFGNEMLFIGMTTEVIVFILSAFDRPVQDYAWEEVFPVLSGKGSIGRGLVMKQSFSEEQIGREAAAGEPITEDSITREPIARGPIVRGPITRGPIVREPVSGEPFNRGAAIREPMTRETVGREPIAREPFAPGSVPSESDPYGTYPIEHETFRHNLSSTSEEYGRQMESLNRTLSGLNSLYEVQLKNISGQLGTIEQINAGLNRLRSVYSDALPDGTSIKEETDKMARQLKELNDVYGRMLHAMTVHGGNYPASRDDYFTRNDENRDDHRSQRGDDHTYRNDNPSYDRQ